jgi:hypothetical protein
MVTRGPSFAGAAAPISAPTQKCLPDPRSTTMRTAGSAASRVTSPSNASSIAWLWRCPCPAVERERGDAAPVDGRSTTASGGAASVTAMPPART